jgi:SAM-dependent methyltransferase
VPFRPAFECLWCGRAWETRSPTDLEGWASLCPDCLGRAQDNPFLRFRLREALRERAAADPAPGPAEAPGPDDMDDWYLRRGRYQTDAATERAFQMELDEVTAWLDQQPLGPEIVELAAGTGWWSPLLAQKGRLWLYDSSEDALERARARLVAHGLRAHSHARDLWGEPDRQTDGVFVARQIGRLEASRLVPFLEVTRRWLREGGRVAFVDERRGDLDGRLRRALEEAGFRDNDVRETAQFFIMGSARQ